MNYFQGKKYSKKYKKELFAQWNKNNVVKRTNIKRGLKSNGIFLLYYGGLVGVAAEIAFWLEKRAYREKLEKERLSKK